MQALYLGLVLMLSLLFSLLPGFAGESPREIALNWQFTPPRSHVTFAFQRAYLLKDSLRFEIVAHNTHPKAYQCLLVTAGEKAVPMDDDEGGEYKGVSVSFAKGLDNKLALNQRKTFTLTIPAPDTKVSLVNLHFGLFARDVSERSPCPKPQTQGGYNFHELNWDVSWMR